MGASVCGKAGFDFDIRIQMGAGAYICGEETALISSCEGLRGDPKNRPPVPGPRGLSRPTDVGQQRGDPLLRGADPREGLRVVLGHRLSWKHRHEAAQHLGRLHETWGLRGSLRHPAARGLRDVRRGGPDGRTSGWSEWQDGRRGRLRSDDLLRRPGNRRVVDGLRPRSRRARDRIPVSAVLHSRELRVLHAMPGWQRPAQGASRQDSRRVWARPTDLDYLRQLGESIKMASRCGLGQTSPNPGSVHARELSPGL